MSACGSSLRHIFESTIPENSSSSSLIDSFSSFRQIRALKPPADHSFTEIFGELYFKEDSNPIIPSSSSSSKISEGYSGIQQDEYKWGNNNNNNNITEDKRNVYQESYHRRSNSFSSLNSESLQLCTEGLGSESTDDVEDLKIDFSSSWQNQNNNKNINNKNNNYCYENKNKMREKMPVKGYSDYQYRKGKINGKTFPPPISSIGRTGKPCVCFQSFRKDGRFVLKEMKIPTHERLHASREDGRLRLCFIQPFDQDHDDTGEVVDDEDNEDGEEKEDIEEKKEEAEVRDDVERGHY